MWRWFFFSFFSSRIQNSSFQRFEESASFKGRISFPETFANLKVAPLAVAHFRFSSDVVFVSFFFPRLCMRSHPVLHTPSHARSQANTQLIRPHSLLHMRHAQSDSWPRPPGRRGWCPRRRGERLVGGDEPGSSALSPDIHTQWVHSLTCLIAWADWGRGSLKVAPRRAGGPQNCDGSWFISVYNHSCTCFCILLCCNIVKNSWFLIFGCPWFSLGRHQVCFFVVVVVIWSSFPKTTAPITQKLCRHVSQRIRCRCFAFFCNM